MATCAWRAKGPVLAAARRAGIHDALVTLPKGYDTMLTDDLADKEDPQTWWRWWPVLMIPAVVALTVVLVRRRFTVVTVRGDSMLPTLADGDRVLVRRMPLDRVRRDQVVVVESPESLSAQHRPGGTQGRPGAPRTPMAPNPPRWPSPPTHQVRGRRWMIKRAAALPGDPLPDALLGYRVSADATLVPKGQFVVLGDNSASSYDSREIGFFPAERLLGAVTRRITTP